MSSAPHAPTWFERVVDSDPWRGAEALARRHDEARRELRRRRRSGHPHLASYRALEARRAPADPAWRLDALRLAVDAGAHDDAAALAETLAAELGAMPASLRRRALPSVLAPWLVAGELERAAELGHRHLADLDATVAGATLAGQLGLRAERLELPDGRLDVTALARAIERGAVEADALERRLARRPLELLRRPHLHLLLWNARRAGPATAAAAALARFLRAAAVPTARLARRSDNVLDDLEFAPAPPRRGPLVSVVMSAYDAGRTIGYAIRSLLAQSYRDLELLIADDGSTDDTAAAIAGFAGDPRIRRFRSRANQGTYNVRNALIAEARGELVTFHDADDLAAPDRIARQVAALRRPDVVASMTCLLRLTADGRAIAFRDQGMLRLAMVSTMAPRRLFLDAGGFRPARYAADLDFHEALRARHGDRAIAIVRRPLILGLAASTSLTRQAGSEALEGGLRAPGRRRYGQLLFDRLVGRIDDAGVGRALRELGNHAEPVGVEPV